MNSPEEKATPMSSTLSKEEILDKEHWNYVVGKGISCIHTTTFPEGYKQQAFIAMDEYAKQENKRESIECAAWAYESGYSCFYVDGTRLWNGRKYPRKLVRKPLTDDQLYELYTKQKQG